MIIFIVILLLLLFYKTKLSSIGEYFEDFLSLNNSKSIKGICCFFIVIHHISINLSDPGLFSIFVDIGYLSVSLFFFYSGYGLMKSLETKDDYLNGFIIKRLPTILISFWLVNIIYIFVNIILGEKYSFISMISYITGIKLINSNAWYVITIILFYLSFYFFI